MSWESICSVFLACLESVSLSLCHVSMNVGVTRLSDKRALRSKKGEVPVSDYKRSEFFVHVFWWLRSP